MEALLADDGAPAPEVDPALYDVATDPDVARAVLDGAFGHGYLATVGPAAELPGFLAQWRTTTVGPVVLRTAPRTVVTTSRGEGGTVIVLGHPVDVDGATTDAQVIADRLRSVLAGADADAAVREAAYIAGRWTMLLLTGGDGESRSSPLGSLTVLPDTMGTQPVFYSVAADGVTLGSSDVLVALARDLPVDGTAARVLAATRHLHPKGVVYLPGNVNSFERVSQVVPNCLLKVDLAHPKDARHMRFWPFTDRIEDDDLDAVHEEFAFRMRRQLELFATFGRTGWSLTGGLDSRVALAHVAHPVRSDTFAFTYFNPRDGVRDPDAARDVFVANVLALRLGLPHRVLQWRQAPATGPFAALHRATYPVSVSSHGAAYAMWADLPHDFFEIQGNGGEIGTMFRKDRRAGPLTGAKAAHIWLGRPFAEHLTFTDIFDSYLAHAELTDDRLRGYNHHDVLYWEHRMGRWGWTKFLVGDFSHRILPPFNDRRLLEVMLRLPEDQRVGKALYARVLELAPRLQVADHL